MKYVDTEAMLTLLGDMKTTTDTLNTTINDYDTSTPSINGSSFESEIQGLLNDLKNSYSAMVAPIENMRNDILKVEAEYRVRAQKLSNLRAQGASGGSGRGVNQNLTK